MLDDSEVERVLCVMAHPDDVDFGCAGTIAGWTDKGIDVRYCLVTDGDAGGFDPAVPRLDIPGIRRAEQTAAAKEVGVTDLTFLGYPDGRLTVTIELRRDISRVIRQVRPQRVVTQTPVRNWQRIAASHPDHMAAAEATMCAVYPDARNAFAHPELLLHEGLEPWVVPEVWLSGGVEPNHYSDITETFERKVTALGQHVSQNTGGEGFDERMRTWAGAIAQRGGLAEGRLAEVFQVVGTA